MDHIISKYEFIKQLKKEITIFDSELKDIDKSWDSYERVAKTALSGIPKIGFFTSSKIKLKAYHDIRSDLYNLCRQSNLGDSSCGIVELILEYSSTSFSRALRAHTNKIEDRVLHSNPSRIKNIIILIGSIVLWTVIAEWTVEPISNIHNYYMYEYNQETRGVITESGVRRASRGSFYDITYMYRAGNDVYVNAKQVNFNSNYGSVSDATANKYPVGMNVVVYYDRDHPGRSVLERSGLGIKVWLDVCFIIFMSSITYYVYRK